MSAKELADVACQDAFKDGITKMVAVLFQGWISADSPAEKDKLVARFAIGLGVHKEAYDRAQRAISQSFP